MRKRHKSNLIDMNDRSKRYSKSKNRFWIFFSIVLSLLVVTGIYIFNSWLDIQRQLKYMRQVVEVDTFYNGIFIDEVSLNGMYYVDAEEKLNSMTKQRLEQISFELVFEDEKWTIDHSDIDARYDTDKLLKQAFGLGREGTLLERYNNIKSLETNNVRMYSALVYDKTLLENIIIQISAEINKDPEDATIEFFPDIEDKFVITPEKYGLNLDNERVLNTLVYRIENEHFGQLILEPNLVNPNVYSAELKGFTSRIVDFHTEFGTSSDNRIHNVVLAMSKINGMKLNPGEVFSFNETVGRRSIERGFRPAPIIMPDRSMRDSPGGGVCQASTMMYNAALRANLEIIERRHHSFPVFYVPAGQDAAVVYGAVDVKFKNNRESPVFFRTFYQDHKIHVQVYGAPFENNGSIRIDSTILETIAAPDSKRIVDTEREHVKYPGEEKVHVVSRNGLRVRTVMTYLENDVEVWSKVVSNDFYRPIQGIIYYLPPVSEKELTYEATTDDFQIFSEASPEEPD